MLNVESIRRLLLLHKDEPQIRKFIEDILYSFEEYHTAVYKEQVYRRIYGSGTEDTEAYRDRVVSLDRLRTVHHNNVIANVGILNRLAQSAGIPPVYDGVVSEERPHRRELANAVFAYVEEIINNRS